MKILFLEDDSSCVRSVFLVVQEMGHFVDCHQFTDEQQFAGDFFENYIKEQLGDGQTPWVVIGDPRSTVVVTPKQVSAIVDKFLQVHLGTKIVVYTSQETLNLDHHTRLRIQGIVKKGNDKKQDLKAITVLLRDDPAGRSDYRVD